MVLSDIHVAMEQGKVYGFSGNNGSGKTVLMKCICGFLPVTEGTIWVGGKAIGIETDFPESIGVIIETPGFLTNLTGFQNLEILAGLRKQISKEEIREAIRKAGLDPDLKSLYPNIHLGCASGLALPRQLWRIPSF